MTDLTARQAEVVKRFCCGKTYREVAAELDISPATVNPVLKVVARKLGTTHIGRKVLCKLLDQKN